MTPPIGATRAGIRGIPVGDDIPDSVNYQWRVEDFSDPWPANVSTVDMSITGLTSSTFSNGEDSVFGDGTDDHGLADGPENIPSSESFGVAFTTQYSNVTSDGYWCGVRDGNAELFVRTSASGTDGGLEFTLSDNNGNALNIQSDNAFDDGTPKAVVMNKTGNRASDMDIYVSDMSNGAQIATTTADDQAFDHTNYSSAVSMGFYDVYIDGSFIDANLEAEVGVIEFNSDAYSEQERQDFVSRRPEV